MAQHSSKQKAPADWHNLPDEALLQMRIRDLRLRLDQSPLQTCIERLYTELTERQLIFSPPCYLADEWLCPDREPIIGIPFCLAHPRLIKLEKKMMFEVEGDSTEKCMQLLRHECGHAINYAYRLYKRTRWRELFGHFTEPYPRSYLFRPYSRRYVVHLPDCYAQRHPDEDFAESFAVWLTPGSNWRTRYKEWPAITKLLYIDRIMLRLQHSPPVYTSNITPWAADRMTSTLAVYYERKRRDLGADFPGYYDNVLQTVFRHSPDGHEPAARFLLRHRKTVMDAVAQWTGHRKYDIFVLMQKLGRRAGTLKLYRTTTETVALAQITGLVAAVCSRTFKAADGNPTENYMEKKALCEKCE